MLRLSSYRDLPDELQQSWSHLCHLTFEKCQADFSQLLASSSLSAEFEIFGRLKRAVVERDEMMFSFIQLSEITLRTRQPYILALPHVHTL